MNNRKLILAAFILVALAQLYVPAKMILDRENVLTNGIEFKFRTAPIDPNDPFRGKYINLQYENSLTEIQSEEDWLSGEVIYVILTKDTHGFATITSVSKTKPSDEFSFVKAKVRFMSTDRTLAFDYPFDRYYMEESKAYEAEQVYRESLPDSTQVAYALVKIKDGEAVLKDVLINGVSIRDIVSSERKEIK
ncbi:MAG: GDYXXLXY domain-containing protein [Lentimicrobium sp.]|jgi:uncharacterized membrane-anchored protein|nr:GDYXXLXY domain-containing protein [Lentimicrobium sp.]